MSLRRDGPVFPRRDWAAFLAVAAIVFPIHGRGMVNLCPQIDDAATMSNLTVSTPVLEYTVTTFDPSWFIPNSSGNAPTLFTLVISPAMRPYADSGWLRLRIFIEADTSLGRDRSALPLVALDRITQRLDPLAHIGVPLTSSQVFNIPSQFDRVSFEQSDLYNLVVAQRVTPEMNLHFKFRLTCEDQGTTTNMPLGTEADIRVVDIANFPGGPQRYGELRYVRTVQALSPGTDIANPRPISIYTLNPVFQIASELFNNQEFIYAPGENKMEIFLYQLDPGQNPADAMQGMEFAKFPVPNQYPVAYPAGLPRLVPGKVYVWRARALLRGPDAEYRYSNALYFLVDPLLDGGAAPQAPSILTDLQAFTEQVKYGDDYVKRVMAALKIILGENYEVFDLSRANKIPAKGQIRLNGRPYSLEELERLAREFHQSHHSITRLRFQ